MLSEGEAREVRAVGQPGVSFGTARGHKSPLLIPESLFLTREQVRGFTIDKPDSKDLDDALWIERDGLTGHLVHISIAAVSALVEPEDPLDAAAREKGFTRYYQDHNDPMLPHELSEDLLSLHEGQKRPAVTVTFPIGRAGFGEPVFRETYLRSERKLSHAEATHAIQNPAHQLHEQLKLLDEIALGLVKLRRKRGALTICNLKKGLLSGEDGRVLSVPSEEVRGHLIVQEFMMLCNQAVAALFHEHGIPALFRNHRAHVGWTQAQLMRDIQDPVNIEGERGLAMLSSGLFGAFGRAFYSPLNEGHFALNLPGYAHTSSPIRRYADLVDQRILVAIVRGEPSPYTFDDLMKIAADINRLQDADRDRQKELQRWEADRATIEAVKNLDLQYLDDAHFRRLLAGTFAGNIRTVRTEDLKAEVLRRTAEEGMPSRTMGLLLLSADADWLEVKRELVKTLDPVTAHSVLSNIAGRRKQRLSFEPTVSGDRYESVARIITPGAPEQTAAGSGRTWKEAKHIAAMKLLFAMLPADLTEGIDMLPEDGAPIHEKVSVAPKTRLFALCQHFSLCAPKFEHHFDAASGHFQATGRVVVHGDTVIESVKSSAPRKRDAEGLASEDLLTKLAQQGFCERQATLAHRQPEAA